MRPTKSVYFKDQGIGPPILFLHGNPDTSDVWDAVIADLQRDHRCMAPDLPGFGRTSAIGNPDCTFENLGRILGELIDGINVPLPLNLVAHDFGGAFGMSWAIQHPAQVRRIIVINHPFFIAGYRWHIWARIYRTPLLGEFALKTLNWSAFYRIVRYGSRRLERPAIRRMYLALTGEWKRMVLCLYRAGDPSAFREWEPRMLRLTEHVPTLVLWGDTDPWVPMWIADRYGAARVTHFPDSGHWPPAEVPDRVAAEIRDFLN